MIAETGVDYFALLPFTHDLASYGAENSWISFFARGFE